MSSSLTSSLRRHGQRLAARGLAARSLCSPEVQPTKFAVPQTMATTRWHSTASNNKQQYEDGSLKTPMPDNDNNETPLMEKQSNKGFFTKIWEKYSIKHQTNRILVAESFLQAATRQATDPRWFGEGRIASDFRSQQALLTMHVWFLHKRLISETQDPHKAAMIQEELFDIFWTDTSNRMRAHGVNEWLINKNLKTVQQYSFMHCFHYDHCYTDLLDSPEERLAELKRLVQTHILLLNPDKDDSSNALEQSDEHAERLAWYIEAQYQNIVHDLPHDLFHRARIAWVDLPDFNGMMDATGKELQPFPMDPQYVLPKNWVRNVANDGSYYYWNTETRQAQWEKPTK